MLPQLVGCGQQSTICLLGGTLTAEVMRGVDAGPKVTVLYLDDSGGTFDVEAVTKGMSSLPFLDNETTSLDTILHSGQEAGACLNQKCIQSIPREYFGCHSPYDTNMSHILDRKEKPYRRDERGEIFSPYEASMVGVGIDEKVRETLRTCSGLYAISRCVHAV